MLKHLLFGFILMGWASLGGALDLGYYQAHPEVIEDAIKQCKNPTFKGPSCADLQKQAEKMNDLAYQMHLNPQEFGKKILMLQTLTVKQDSQLQQTPNDERLRAAYLKNKQQLQERLVIIKWLQSPKS